MPLSTTATLIFTPDSRWRSGVAAPVQACVAPTTNGNIVSRFEGAKPVFGGATGLGAGGRGAGFAGNVGTEGITCTTESGDTYRTFGLRPSDATAVCGSVATNAGTYWKSSLTWMPGTCVAIVADCTSALIFWTMTRTSRVGSA